MGGTGHGAVVVAGGDVFRRPVFGGGAGLGFEARPQGGIVHGQFFKTEAAHEAGGAVEGDPGSFDGEGAAAAEGVLEGPAAVVACQKQQAGGEVFAQGGFAGVLAVAAFEQGFAAGVEEDLRGFVVEEDADADVGAVFVYRGAAAGALAEVVAEGVFGFEADEVEAFDGGAAAFGLYFDGVAV